MATSIFNLKLNLNANGDGFSTPGCREPDIEHAVVKKALECTTHQTVLKFLRENRQEIQQSQEIQSQESLQLQEIVSWLHDHNRKYSSVNNY